jgi:hypothetical protein
VFSLKRVMFRVSTVIRFPVVTRALIRPGTRGLFSPSTWIQ